MWEWPDSVDRSERKTPSVTPGNADSADDDKRTIDSWASLRAARASIVGGSAREGVPMPDSVTGVEVRVALSLD